MSRSVSAGVGLSGGGADASGQGVVIGVEDVSEQGASGAPRRRARRPPGTPDLGQRGSSEHLVLRLSTPSTPTRCPRARHFCASEPFAQVRGPSLQSAEGVGFEPTRRVVTRPTVFKTVSGTGSDQRFLSGFRRGSGTAQARRTAPASPACQAGGARLHGRDSSRRGRPRRGRPGVVTLPVAPEWGTRASSGSPSGQAGWGRHHPAASMMAALATSTRAVQRHGPPAPPTYGGPDSPAPRGDDGCAPAGIPTAPDSRSTVGTPVSPS